MIRAMRRHLVTLSFVDRGYVFGPVLLLFKLSFAETSYLDMYWM
jgi:hypothetical protein